MTTNIVVDTVVDDWINLHTLAGISVGTQLVCQIKGHHNSGVVFVDSVTKPGAIDTAGGVETIGALPSVVSSPDVGESTWAQARGDDIVKISVQDQ